MQSANVTVKYINPPKGKGPASIKDDAGKYWKFWTKDIPLETFKQGETYQVGFHTEQYQGQDQFYIDAAGSTAAPTKANGAATPQQTKYGATDDKTAERIFVCGALNAAISAGKCELEASDLIANVNVLREAFQNTFGKN